MQDPTLADGLAERHEEPQEPRERGIPLPLHSTWLTQALLVLNLLVFAMLTLFSGVGILDALWNGAGNRALVFFGAKYNPAIVDGEYWRLVTPIFLHIGLIHLLFNQFALSIFGRELERIFGTARFAAIYFLAGMAGSVTSFLFSPAVSAGASGAIFGIIGAQALFFLRNRDLLGEAASQQFRSLMGLIGVNLLLGFTIPGIDNFGHLGGLAAGVVLGVLLAPTYSIERLAGPPFARIRERPPALPTWAVVLLGLAVVAVVTFAALPLAPVRPG